MIVVFFYLKNYITISTKYHYYFLLFIIISSNFSIPKFSFHLSLFPQKYKSVNFENFIQVEENGIITIQLQWSKKV